MGGVHSNLVLFLFLASKSTGKKVGPLVDHVDHVDHLDHVDDWTMWMGWGSVAVAFVALAFVAVYSPVQT